MHKYTVVFGCGEIGKKFIKNNRFIKKNHILFCDNDKAKVGNVFSEIEIVSFDTLVQMNIEEKIERIIIAVGVKDAVSIYKQCVLGGITEKIMFGGKQTGEVVDFENIFTDNVFSQDGEERFLKEYFGNKKEGIFIDVGANHPYRYSNSYWSYNLGWRGICIEPDILNYNLLCEFRPRDKIYNIGVSDKETVLTYYKFSENALNTFSTERAQELVGLGWKFEKIDIKVLPLCSILEDEGICRIDYMDIDVEGMEMKVLKGIDFDKIDIEILLVEQLDAEDLEDVLKSEINIFLEEKGYKAINKFNRTVIYQQREKEVFDEKI